ncbi:hypothetical protein H8M03_02910 [Sphingomonas sabuli]|uniref:PIN like domain-containing protein n=1 Tax=Sphingomonas sabuli TaxID=2764186 RepID=A0A7G9L3W3_9SPHN|nr:PIN-like domain-containing protein [Sphingomonas sabuli]QNM83312.1 hypothetical protein H8M03_02910 [Sphingomonas sabuli]
MIFPEVIPSRAECQRVIIEAIKSSGARIYVDASVLIHCYEMSRSACEELLNALDSFGDSVRVPVWSAKETWDHTRRLKTRRPLAKTAAALTRRMTQFRTESLRYVDEKTFDDLSADQFADAVNDAAAMIEDLTKRTHKIEPGHEAANARLLPFIAKHSIPSNMAEIYREVSETGETRFAHEVPPGFGDGGQKAEPTDSDEDEQEGSLKGKKTNRHGDLIMWLEALQDCDHADAKHLIILTRDNSKRDWAYKPERVLGDDDVPQENAGLVTLPMPLLTQEAKQRCRGLEGVHVISLEMFTQVARSSFGARVINLVRALQPATRVPRTRPGPAGRVVDLAPEDAAKLADISFSSMDMIYERPDEEKDDSIWRQIDGLRAEGWTAQNKAASELQPLIASANPDQLKQIGRGIIAASNEEALGPVDLATAVLGNRELPPGIRANLLVGLLAETYFDENGEPAKPVASPDVASLLFDHAMEEDTRRAYSLTIERLAPYKNSYLALPGEEVRSIRLEIQTAQSALQSVQADGVELIEPDAPESRRLTSSGLSGSISVTDLVAVIAREFVIPTTMLEVDGPTNFQFEIPERAGFISWGPLTGETLR